MSVILEFDPEDTHKTNQSIPSPPMPMENHKIKIPKQRSMEVITYRRNALPLFNFVK
jgi:hypothetical protein